MQHSRRTQRTHVRQMVKGIEEILPASHRTSFVHGKHPCRYRHSCFRRVVTREEMEADRKRRALIQEHDADRQSYVSTAVIPVPFRKWDRVSEQGDDIKGAPIR